MAWRKSWRDHDWTRSAGNTLSVRGGTQPAAIWLLSWHSKGGWELAPNKQLEMNMCNRSKQKDEICSCMSKTTNPSNKSPVQRNRSRSAECRHGHARRHCDWPPSIDSGMDCQTKTVRAPKSSCAAHGRGGRRPCLEQSDWVKALGQTCGEVFGGDGWNRRPFRSETGEVVDLGTWKRLLQASSMFKLWKWWLIAALGSSLCWHTHHWRFGRCLSHQLPTARAVAEAVGWSQAKRSGLVGCTAGDYIAEGALGSIIGGLGSISEQCLGSFGDWYRCYALHGTCWMNANNECEWMWMFFQCCHECRWLGTNGPNNERVSVVSTGEFRLAAAGWKDVFLLKQNMNVGFTFKQTME